MLAALLLASVGWLGLALILTTTLPTLGARWLFFAFLTAAVTGTALPFVWLLHRRFETAPAGEGVLLRRGLMTGLFISLCTWLQINRSLNLSLTLAIALAFVLIEGLVRLVERSRWKPGA